MKTTHTFIAAAFGLAACSLTVHAADGPGANLTLSSEMEYSSGKYGGNEATDILYLPFVAKLESGPALFKLTVPYVEINSPGKVQIVNAMPPGPGPGPLVAGPIVAATPRGRASGLGDMVASASYNVFYDAPSGLLLDLGGKIKLPTADKDKGLGTGKFDLGLQADVYKTLGRATTLLASLGYTWMGKPEGENFRNIAYASLGVAHPIDPDTTLSAFLDYRQAVVAGSAAPRELTVYLTRRLDKNWKIQAYLLAGMSDASPRKGLGATLAYSM